MDEEALPPIDQSCARAKDDTAVAAMYQQPKSKSNLNVANKLDVERHFVQKTRFWHDILHFLDENVIQLPPKQSAAAVTQTELYAVSQRLPETFLTKWRRFFHYMRQFFAAPSAT